MAAATCVQYPQKALTEINVLWAIVISDLTGMTGLAVLRASHILVASTLPGEVFGFIEQSRHSAKRA